MIQQSLTSIRFPDKKVYSINRTAAQGENIFTPLKFLDEDIRTISK